LLGEGLRRRLDVTRARRRWLPFTRTRQPRADGLPGTEVYTRPVLIPAPVRWIGVAAGAALLVYAAWRGPRVPASLAEREAADAALASMESRRSPAAVVPPQPTAPRSNALENTPASAAAEPVSPAASEPVAPSSIDPGALEPALFQPNDLPAGYGASNFSPRAPASLSGVPKPAVAATAQLDFNGLNNGRVTALFYASTAERDAAFTALAAAQTSIVPLPSEKAAPTIGERMAVAQHWTGDVVVFARCGAVVQLNAAPPTSQAGPRSGAGEFRRGYETVLRYAQNLDTRLAPPACAERD